MLSGTLLLGIIFLLQTVLGILGNICLLFHYLFLYFTHRKLKHTDLTLLHLTVANVLAVTTKGIPKVLTFFGWRDFLHDLGCKLVLYVHRVGRGVSFSSTCLLSIFQAITICPNHSWGAELKTKAPMYMGVTIVLCWALHVLVNIIFPVFVFGNWKNDTIAAKKTYGLCTSVRHDQILDTLYTLLLSFPDAVCLALMLWASGFMVFILYRHKKQVQHIHRNVSPRASPETRATQTIIVLVSTFVSFYTLSSVFQSFVSVSYTPSQWLLYIDAMISLCYPTISPFILMNRLRSPGSALHR